jgi:4-amino-4-deoxy-L-arabinose transferase-like glycosyltransferase
MRPDRADALGHPERRDATRSGTTTAPGVAGEATVADTTPAGPPGLLTGSSRLSRAGKVALAFALASGLLTHGYHLFEYPLYNTDEGIYLERAWAVIREHRLSPQTYFYDHAPGGWLTVALWELLLPGQFETFGNPVNSGRVLMVIIHVASTFLLFEIARRLSGGGLLAPILATFFFNFSPLAIYYQRMILLDNIMVFWVLLSIYLLLRRDKRLFTGLWSGLAFGISILTKENAIFFAPTIYYLLSRQTKYDANRKFVLTFWTFATCTAVLIYFLFATLKGELLPPKLDFSLSHQPQGHVSLLYEMWYQLHRNRGTLFVHGSYLYTIWLPKDAFLFGAGTVATLIALYLGWRDKERNLGLLVAGTLCFEIAFYLARGSVILDFYVIPLIPMLALNVGLVADRMARRIPAQAARVVVPMAMACLTTFLFLPTGDYVIVHGEHGQLKLSDVYYLPLTYLQQEEIAWVRAHIPPTDKIITDDDIWVQLHDVRPYYPYAQSHWNAASDPQIRNKIFKSNWRNIDYIVLSNGMKHAMILNNTGGQEGYILEALDYHSTEVWQASRGNVKLAIYRIQK